MNVLIACEESQRVCAAFREKGYTAYSCDIEKCGGGHQEWHINGDVLPLLNAKCSFITQDGAKQKIEDRWDLIIAHPPCTYLTVTGNRWFDTGKYGKYAWDRMTERNKAIGFFYRFVMADCDHIAIENPCGIMSTAYRKPDQTIQPYMFGDPFEKKTCLWLKGLIPLLPTNIVKPQQRKVFKSGKSLPAWFVELKKEERSKERSRTFQGIANAMAEQWGNFISTENQIAETTNAKEDEDYV